MNGHELHLYLGEVNPGATAIRSDITQLRVFGTHSTIEGLRVYEGILRPGHEELVDYRLVADGETFSIDKSSDDDQKRFNIYIWGEGDSFAMEMKLRENNWFNLHVSFNVQGHEELKYAAEVGWPSFGSQPASVARLFSSMLESATNLAANSDAFGAKMTKAEEARRAAFKAERERTNIIQSLAMARIEREYKVSARQLNMLEDMVSAYIRKQKPALATRFNAATVKALENKGLVQAHETDHRLIVLSADITAIVREIEADQQ